MFDDVHQILIYNVLIYRRSVPNCGPKDLPYNKHFQVPVSHKYAEKCR